MICFYTFLEFNSDSSNLAKPAQMEEILTLQDFANANNFNYPIQLWDLPYWSRKFKYSIFK